MAQCQCSYCKTFSESPTRINSQRFCLFVRAMIYGENPICEEFDVTTHWWCKNRQCQLSVEQCSHAQTNPVLWPECVKCHQKETILEIRRFIGFRKNKQLVGQISEVSHIPPNEPEVLIPPRPRIEIRRSAT